MAHRLRQGLRLHRRGTSCLVDELWRAVESRYYLSSLPPNATLLGQAIRQQSEELLKVETLDETEAYLAAGVLRAPREENASSQPTSGQKPSAPLGHPAEV